MTLALAVAFLAHPLAWLLGLASLGLIGLAVNAANPILNFGAFTVAGASQLIANTATYVSTLAAAVTAGVIPQNVLTGGGDVYLLSSATVPGNQTTRTAAQLFADAAAQLGLSLTDPVFANGYQYTLTITQIAGATLTLVAGTGVTITGAATVAANTTRTFVVNLLPTTATFTSIGTGSYS
jgi:hypothetical protein